MNLLTNSSSLVLWQDVIKHAEDRCSVCLKKDLESYLVCLLVRYTNKPQVVNQVVASAFLEALKLNEKQRNLSLQHVGDQCLLFAGLFPRLADKRNVKINYFVDLGRSAYASVSSGTDGLFKSLAIEFVLLMDVLQSIRQSSDLLPLDAYEQWNELGSQRALKILQEYANAIPIRRRPS